MLTARRDGAHGGARNAIPSIGEVEGRLAVMEILVRSSLSCLLKEKSEHTVNEDILMPVRKAIRSRCSEMKLCGEDADSAIAYAEELIQSVSEEL